jgi:hypothetical protein
MTILWSTSHQPLVSSRAITQHVVSTRTYLSFPPAIKWYQSQSLN